MRLRPSGNQGPVATGFASFTSYQGEQAWVWEHLALTRARAIAGPKALADDIEQARLAILADKGERSRVLAGVADMRRRVREAKAPEGALDAKIGPGRMMEIELIAQAGALMAASPARDVASGLAACVATGWIDAAGEAALARAYGLSWAVVQALRLLGTRGVTTDVLGAGAAHFVLRETGQDSLAQLAATYAEATAEAAETINRALAPFEGDTNDANPGRE